MFKITSLLAFFIICLAVTFAVWQGQQALPIMEGTLSLRKLQGTVNVYFDREAVPYIQAGSEADLCLAQGYVTAAERMFQMDMLRRTAEGELSEIFGMGCLGHDRLVRTIGFNRLAKIELNTLSVEAKDNLQAYCDGVNSYLARSAKAPGLECLMLGYKPRLWQIQDTLAILKYLQYQIDESWRLDELRSRVTDKVGNKLADTMFEQVPLRLPQAPAVTNLNVSLNRVPNLLSEKFLEHNGVADGSSKFLWGSSAWAIAKAASSSKGSLLACSKDSVFTFPDMWYLCSLESSTFHAAGATIAGVPGVIVGRNENIGWAVTAVKADVQDLFVEQFSDNHPDKCRVPGGWSKLFSVEEEIPVRFSQDSTEKIYISRHGPLLFKDKDKGVALSWTGLQVSHSVFETIWQLDKASNWSEFRSILRNYNGSPQNFLYVDRQGNIGSQMAGNIPMRKCDRRLDRYILSSGSKLLAGWLDDCLWVERVSFDDMSFSFNSPDEFVIAGDSRSAVLPTNRNNNSPERILAVLSQYRKTSQKLDLGEMALLQADQSAPLNALIKTELGKALLRTNSVDTYKQQALMMLNSWDGQLRADSPVASIYESFVITVLKRILEPKIGSELACQYVERWPRWTGFVAKVMREKPADLLPPGERSYETFFLTSFTEALKNVRLSLQSEQAKDWQWQRLHPVDFLSMTQEKVPNFITMFASLLLPAKAQSLGVGGDQDSINAADMIITQAPWQYRCTSGSTERLLIDMADQDKFYQTLSLGQSGHLFSKNRSDQLKAWLNNDQYTIAFSSKQLRLQACHTLVLTNVEPQN